MTQEDPRADVPLDAEKPAARAALPSSQVRKPGCSATGPTRWDGTCIRHPEEAIPLIPGRKDQKATRGRERFSITLWWVYLVKNEQSPEEVMSFLPPPPGAACTRNRSKWMIVIIWVYQETHVSAVSTDLTSLGKDWRQDSSRNSFFLHLAGVYLGSPRKATVCIQPGIHQYRVPDTAARFLKDVTNFVSFSSCCQV